MNKKNLSNQLTVFLISSGQNPNLNDCISALKNQTVDFTLKKIINIAPMSKAFQEMLNQCETDYFIEVDGDMVLFSDAIERLYNAIITTDERHPMVCYQLLDVHLDFAIYGVKIYKHNVFKNYPYNHKHPSCEVEQLDKMKEDGYVFDEKNAGAENTGRGLVIEIIGTHSPYWTNQGIFERYFNLMRKYRQFGYWWMKRLPKKLMRKVLKTPTEQNIYAFMGCIVGLFNKGSKGEKDFRKVNRYFAEIQEFMKVKK